MVGIVLNFEMIGFGFKMENKEKLKTCSNFISSTDS